MKTKKHEKPSTAQGNIRTKATRVGGRAPCNIPLATRCQTFYPPSLFGFVFITVHNTQRNRLLNYVKKRSAASLITTEKHFKRPVVTSSPAGTLRHTHTHRSILCVGLQQWLPTTRLIEVIPGLIVGRIHKPCPDASATSFSCRKLRRNGIREAKCQRVTGIFVTFVWNLRLNRELPWAQKCNLTIIFYFYRTVRKRKGVRCESLSCTTSSLQTIRWVIFRWIIVEFSCSGT